MLRFISLFVLSEHCVQDGQQFTHTVNQRHFFGFSGCWQMHVKRLFHRIKPGYHKRCHVQGCSCLRTRTGVVRPADMCGITGMLCELNLNRPGFPGECFICELRLPDHRFRWKHNKLFLLLPEEYGPAFPAIVDCYTSPPT